MQRLRFCGTAVASFASSLSIVSCYLKYVFTYFWNRTQAHADGLSSRLRQRDEELAEAASLMTETRRDLTVLRNRAQETEKVTYVPPGCRTKIAELDLGT